MCWLSGLWSFLTYSYLSIGHSVPLFGQYSDYIILTCWHSGLKFFLTLLTVGIPTIFVSLKNKKYLGRCLSRALGLTGSLTLLTVDILTILISLRKHIVIKKMFIDC